MLADILAGVLGSGLAAGLRGSTWLYPLVNAGHIVGIALLFGAIVPLDLRLIGLWQRLPIESLSRVLIPVAGAGFALALACGALLFITKANDYAASTLFQVKMLVLAFALANALGFAVLQRRRKNTVAPRPALSQRIMGAASLTAWLAAILLGRLIGYF
ncbi:MAG: hypothetical protein AB7P52_09020 [Alphaproteobacteria bacterium]